MSKGPKPAIAPVTITIDLQINGSTLDDQVTYSNGADTGTKRKQNLLQKVKDEKKRRGKTYNVPHPDHSEDLAHPSWITNPGDTVTWKCAQPFSLYVEQDLAPCDPERGALQNPFGFNGVQKSTGTGPYQVTGTVQNDASIEKQMFYKFTAWVDGLDPLDPDGICSSGVGP
jgi:hypothetical protein